jgi:hypothetical protein
MISSYLPRYFTAWRGSPAAIHGTSTEHMNEPGIPLVNLLAPSSTKDSVSNNTLSVDEHQFINLAGEAGVDQTMRARADFRGNNFNALSCMT